MFESFYLEFHVHGNQLARVQFLRLEVSISSISSLPAISSGDLMAIVEYPYNIVHLLVGWWNVCLLINLFWLLGKYSSIFTYHTLISRIEHHLVVNGNHVICR